MASPVQRGNTGNPKFWANALGPFLHEFFAGFWWGVSTLWWLLWWSRAVRVGSLILWCISLAYFLLQKSPGALFLLQLASGATVVLWVVPALWSAYRLYTRVRPPAAAAWRRGSADVSNELRSDWMQEVSDLDFTLAGYLMKDREGAPRLALFINPQTQDSAHVSRVAGKDLLVFKSRFTDGFAFETGKTSSVPLLPAIPNNPVFRFSQITSPRDLYKVHQRIKEKTGIGHEPVISNGEGEIDEFISRAEMVRSHMMSRDYRLNASAYRFTIPGAIRHAALLTWPLKPIRESMFHRKTLGELAKLEFHIDKSTGRIAGQ